MSASLATSALLLPGGRFFLDTNILAYAFDDTAPRKQTFARQLLREAASSGQGVVSFQVVQEFINLALKRFTRPMQPADLEKYLSLVLCPMLRVQSSIVLYTEALRLHSANMLSWYDALIVAAAQQARCEVLYTEDIQHGQRFGSLQVVNPFF